MTEDYRLARAASPEGELAAPAEEAAFLSSLMRLLEHRAAIHTMGDSRSVPAEQAVELLRSICFILGIDPEAGAFPEHLLRVDLEREFRLRSADLAHKVEDARGLWRDVCVATPLIPNIALRDTLTEIGEFFAHYDHQSMAHDIPCSIDYPLCHPVDESLQGIEYIAEYLRRLMIETRFLRLFEIARVERVLASTSPDHIGLLVNLYEPVATNTIGLALVDEELVGLEIGDTEREVIAERLRPLSDAGRDLALREAALAACDTLGVADERERQYLVALVPELLPRIEVGLVHASLSGVFVGAGRGPQTARRSR